jgi:hypothetical protein
VRVKEKTYIIYEYRCEIVYLCDERLTCVIRIVFVYFFSSLLWIDKARNRYLLIFFVLGRNDAFLTSRKRLELCVNFAVTTHEWKRSSHFETFRGSILKSVLEGLVFVGIWFSLSFIALFWPVVNIPFGSVGGGKNSFQKSAIATHRSPSCCVDHVGGNHGRYFAEC